MNINKNTPHSNNWVDEYGQVYKAESAQEVYDKLFDEQDQWTEFGKQKGKPQFIMPKYDKSRVKRGSYIAYNYREGSREWVDAANAAMKDASRD